MKYWWLAKYQNFKIIQIKELQDDVNYFLTMSKNYETRYQQLKGKEINELFEEDLLIMLTKIVNTKNIKDNTLTKIIEKLLSIPDNSFPASDYSIKEMLDEIKGLKNNQPIQSKMENNNLAICYHCLNIFYVDKIKSVNKKNLCLCPYCLSTKLYFDNDYIPMNYTFIKLANIYYKTSKLGCTFREIKRILKKNVRVIKDQKSINMIDITELLSNKIKPIDEKIVNKKLYDIFLEKEHNLDNSVTLYIDDITSDCEQKLLIILVTLMDGLSNFIYLKEICIVTNSKKVLTNLNFLLRTLIAY